MDRAHTDPARLKREREKARELKNTNWWRTQISKGLCHYCHQKFKASALTLDHVIPLARGGTSTRGNCVPACKPCNSSKRLDTPTDDLFAQLERERIEKSFSLGSLDETSEPNSDEFDEDSDDAADSDSDDDFR
ncbi:MAG: HNH endonuclease [Cryobacterium sp.]|nr:HNH endonuclease [Oligoflexia bacterium]